MKQITKYQCDYCNRSYVSKYKAKEHESKCFYNPSNKSCVTCKHVDVKEFFDSEGKVYDAVSWCYQMDIEIFRKGCVVKHCVGWKTKEDE